MGPFHKGEKEKNRQRLTNSCKWRMLNVIYKRGRERHGVKTCIIACSMVREELQQAMADTACTYPVTWLDAGLHNYPERLNQTLQRALDQVTGYDRVLLCYGFCGNSIAGIHAGDFEVILPKADDCLTILLGSQKRRLEISQDGGTYFLTKAWIHGERNLLTEYRYAVEKYGEKRGKRIFATMFGHYKQLGLLDTGCDPMEEVSEEAQDMADLLELPCRRIPASIQRLRDLLTGPWPPEWFLHLVPGEALTEGRLSREVCL